MSMPWRSEGWGVVVVGTLPQARQPGHILLPRAPGGTGTAPAPGIRHLPGHGPRDLSDHSPLKSPMEKGTATILSVETDHKILPREYSWKTIASTKYLQFLKFRGISKHALLQPSHKYAAPLFPLYNVEKVFGTFVFQFVFMRMSNDNNFTSSHTPL